MAVAVASEHILHIKPKIGEEFGVTKGLGGLVGQNCANFSVSSGVLSPISCDCRCGVMFLPLLQTTRERKVIYNAYHSFISWIPILAIIIIRNTTLNLRNTYSALFAWIGKCSLEILL